MCCSWRIAANARNSLEKVKAESYILKYEEELAEATIECRRAAKNLERMMEALEGMNAKSRDFMELIVCAAKEADREGFLAEDILEAVETDIVSFARKQGCSVSRLRSRRRNDSLRRPRRSSSTSSMTREVKRKGVKMNAVRVTCGERQAARVPARRSAKITQGNNTLDMSLTGRREYRLFYLFFCVSFESIASTRSLLPPEPHSFENISLSTAKDGLVDSAELRTNCFVARRAERRGIL